MNALEAREISDKSFPEAMETLKKDIISRIKRAAQYGDSCLDFRIKDENAKKFIVEYLKSERYSVFETLPTDAINITW